MKDRLTIQEAAARLGVKEDAVRKRIQRGSLRHEKSPEGRVYVWVDAAQDAAQDAYRDALLAAKDETIAELREQLREERRANDENRRLLLAALERIPPQLEAAQEPPQDAPSDARGSPEAGEGGEPWPEVQLAWMEQYTKFASLARRV